MEKAAQSKEALPEISLQKFEELVAKAYELRAEVEALEEQTKAKNKELFALQSRILAHMLELEKTSYDSAKGKLIIQKRFSVTQPKDPDSRMQFFSYLRSKGLFEQMVSVNHQTLNAFYKAELEAAREKGDFDFTIPGLGEPTYMEYLTMRKK
jgi:hypothetical protein